MIAAEVVVEHKAVVAAAAYIAAGRQAVEEQHYPADNKDSGIHILGSSS